MTDEQEKALIEEEDEQWFAERKAFLAKYPDFPESRKIDCMNLIMRKEFALEILRGTKKVEYRAYTKHYMDRLTDKNTQAYVEAHAGDKEFIESATEYSQMVRQVMKIHFHNYNNTWFLDVECTMNDTVALTKGGVELMHAYGSNELDEELDHFEKNNIADRPLYYYFVLGKVIDTNLKL